MTVRSLFASIVRSLTASAVLFAACSYSAAQGIPCSYEVAHVIQAPLCGGQAQPTVALAISPNGRYVCGYYCACVCINYRSFVCDTQTEAFTTLPLPAGMTTSMANDVNDAGQVVGFVGGTGIQQGFIYDANISQYTHFLSAAVPEHGCTVTGIKTAGVVCGTRGIGGPPGYPTSAFIWDEKTGVFTDLGLIEGMSSHASDIDDDGQVAVVRGVGLAGYIWNGQRLMNVGWLPGADDIRLWEIQAGNRAVGGSLFILGRSFWVVPLVYQNGSLHALPRLSDGLPSCIALATNASGLIAGHCRPINNGDPTHAVTWLGNDIRELQPLLVGANNIVLRSADALTADGDIVANASMNGELVSVVLVPQKGLPGDTNCDRSVNIDDLLTVIGNWGPGASYGDLNHDQVVNITDLLIVIDEWTP
jgi:uncharacterized membrane protein